MSEDKPMILSPGIDAAGVWRIQNSPRALLAQAFYKSATGIKNRAGAFVGMALNQDQLAAILNHKETRGKELAGAFFKQFAQPTESSEVGRFLLVGSEIDMFLDLLAGVPVADSYKRISGIVTAHKAIPADEINSKNEGGRW